MPNAAQNIAKVFSTGMAMFLTPLLSIVMFDLYPSFTLLLGACIASISVVLFYLMCAEPWFRGWGFGVRARVSCTRPLALILRAEPWVPRAPLGPAHPPPTSPLP